MEDKFQKCWSFLLGKTCIPLSIQSPCNTSSQYVIPFYTLFIAVWLGHSFCIKFAYFWPRRPATPLFKTKLCLACLLRRSELPICNSGFRYNCDDMEEHQFFLSFTLVEHSVKPTAQAAISRHLKNNLISCLNAESSPVCVLHIIGKTGLVAATITVWNSLM